MLQKKLCRLLCCIAILCLTATSAFASGTFYGSDRLGSISFDFSDYEPAVSSGSIDLRMVAVWDDSAKALKLCEDYEDALSGVDALFAENAAKKLFVYAEGSGLSAQKIKVGKDGTACAADLASGVYLASQTVPFEGYTCMTPTLISVPLELDGEWIFDVEALPKLEPIIMDTTEPTVPTETTKPPPGVPVTGQINWPVPVLLMGGSFLILLGICLRKEKNHET